MHSSFRQPPEHIHPALWRGSQIARPHRAVIPTGFADLDRELPGQGRPLGSLIELLPSQPGIGEISLVERKRVGEGKRGAGRVERGGRRSSKKKKTKKKRKKQPRQKTKQR